MPKLTGEPVNEKRAERFLQGLEGSLETMENIWLEKNHYIAGDDLTVADLLATCELEQPGKICFD